MLRLSLLSSAVVAFLAAAPAQAASFLSGPSSVTLDRNSPFTWTSNLQATNGDGLVGTTGRIQFSFLSANAAGTAWNFSYLVDNTSTGASAGSELSSFGFNTSGTPSGVASGGALFTAQLNGGNFNGLGQRDVCFYAGPNCNGGSSSGVNVSQAPVTGTFLITFAVSRADLVLSDFAARWQSTGSRLEGSASGEGVNQAVPEPATWGMMLFGFGGLGYAMRRRQKVGVRIRFA